MDVAITEGSSKVTESQNYQPMAKGVRSRLWKEGYDQRIHRKKNGFNHFKLEWMVPTDRGYFLEFNLLDLFSIQFCIIQSSSESNSNFLRIYTLFFFLCKVCLNGDLSYQYFSKRNGSLY